MLSTVIEVAEEMVGAERKLSESARRQKAELKESKYTTACV